jgi:hypothetical protein
MLVRMQAGRSLSVPGRSIFGSHHDDGFACYAVDIREAAAGCS